MSLSAVDCVAPALQHTRQQLFSPFRLGQWSRLALVAVLAGELHVGSCSSGNWGQLAQQRRPMGDEFLAPAFPHIDPARIAQFAGLIAAAVFLAIVLFFVFLYINSMFRFILFDSVLRKECSIGDGWQRYHRPGRRYFLWQLVLVFSTAMFFALLVGVPLMVVGAGAMKDPSGHIASLAGGVILLVLIGVFCVLLLLAIQTLARDFLVPLMALEDLDFADAWSRLLSMIRAEPWRYFGYLFLKLVMTIAAWIMFSILALIPVLFILGPTALLVFAGVAAGLTWNVTTVSLAIILGSVALFVLLYVIALVATPATVFFPAYAMYFFAARYPNLHSLVYPAPVAPPAPEVPPVLETPLQPPPLPPTPEPIG